MVVGEGRPELVLGVGLLRLTRGIRAANCSPSPRTPARPLPLSFTSLLGLPGMAAPSPGPGHPPPHTPPHPTCLLPACMPIRRWEQGTHACLPATYLMSHSTSLSGERASQPHSHSSCSCCCCPHTGCCCCCCCTHTACFCPWLLRLLLLQKFSCPHLTQRLTKLAYDNSIDKRKATPYSWAASEAFNMVYSGGKKDDITVLVAYCA